MYAPLGRVAPRALALILAVLLACGLGTAAHAGKPTKPGVPTDLAIGTVTFSNGAYVVPATWRPGANTTSYLATVTSAGVTLATATLSGTSWAPRIAAKAGTVVSVQVKGVNSKFKSAAAVDTAVLPDLTAPTGEFSAAWSEPTTSTLPVTFTQVALADDVSAPAEISVKVDPGDGSAPIVNPTFPYVYNYTVTVGVAKRYTPTITATDKAGNSSTVPVNAVVVFDSAAPAGAATVSRTTGWARWTAVSLTTTATDNLSPAAAIQRTVAWGDGTTTVTYGDKTLSHVYAVAGTFRPTVTLGDEALPVNTGTAAAAPVVIRKDVYRPTVGLTLPRLRIRSVRSWKVLRGTARDAQTAVKLVRVKVVEKRGTAFYAYQPANGTWVKAGRKAQAFAKAGYAQVSTTRGWSVRVLRLTKGTLVYRVQSVDVMGNASTVVEHGQRLTKR